MPSLLALDVDGVLNSRVRNCDNDYYGIEPMYMRRLNRVLKACHPHIVLVSAWRYMVLGSAMSLDGFHYLLLTHGMYDPPQQHTGLFGAKNPIVGLVRKEDERKDGDRAAALMEWLSACHTCGRGGPGNYEYPGINYGRVCVLDDLDLGYTAAGFRLVQPKNGMTDEDANRVINHLKG